MVFWYEPRSRTNCDPTHCAFLTVEVATAMVATGHIATVARVDPRGGTNVWFLGPV